MKSRIILFFCTFLLANIHTSSADCTPSQIHLSFGDNYYSTNGSSNSASSSSLLNNNQAYLVWQSTELCQYTVKVVDAQTQNMVLNKTVDYTGNFSYNTTGETESQTSTVTLTSYTVLLQNLSYQTKYIYTILDQNNTPISESFPFTLASPAITTVPSKILVVGNFGTQQPQNMTLEAIDELLNENDTYAGMIQIGQVPQSDNATIQTAYINTLPNFTAVYPILMTPTKGDLANNSSFFDFRIRNPLLNVTQNQYFSFNLQGIHFVSINFDYYNALDEAAKNQTYSWIENDLNMANSNASRESAPFIVVISSDPIYCIQENFSNAANCSNFYGQNENWTELFSNYNVDLVISGTMEAYQTLLPVDQNSSYVVDPSSPAYIIEGVGSSFVGAGFGVLYTQNNEFDHRLIYEHFVSDTGDNITALNLIKIKPQSDFILPNNTQNNNGSNTQGNGEEELVGPSVNPNADATSSDIAADPDTSEPIFTRVIIPCIIILAIVAGAYYWKRRKAADPEMERLSVQEYKSNKIYNKRSTDASISMVDLVL